MTKGDLRVYAVPAVVLVAIVAVLNLSFAHLANPAEKISACAFAVSAMSLYTTLNERKGALRAAAYGKRLDAIAEDAKRLSEYFLALSLLRSAILADGLHTERSREARKRFDGASDAHGASHGTRILYFDSRLALANDAFIAAAADFYKGLNDLDAGHGSIEALGDVYHRARQAHIEYHYAARTSIGMDELTADAKKLIGTAPPAPRA